MNTLKIYRIVRTCIFTVLAVLTAIFHDQIIPFLRYFIGALMIFYGLEEFVYTALKEKKHFAVRSLFWNAVEILLGLLLILFLKNDSTSFVTVCTIWATWSILRETKELTECTETFKKKLSSIPDILESLVVIAFSFYLIVSPTEEHAGIHLYLLVAELLAKALFPLLCKIRFARPRMQNEQTEYADDAIAAESIPDGIAEEAAVAGDADDAEPAE